MSWGKYLEYRDQETRTAVRIRHEEQLRWAEQSFPDLPPLLVVQSLPRLRARFGRRGVTKEILRETVEAKCLST